MSNLTTSVLIFFPLLLIALETRLSSPVCHADSYYQLGRSIGPRAEKNQAKKSISHFWHMSNSTTSVLIFLFFLFIALGTRLSSPVFHADSEYHLGRWIGPRAEKNQVKKSIFHFSHTSNPTASVLIFSLLLPIALGTRLSSPLFHADSYYHLVRSKGPSAEKNQAEKSVFHIWTCQI